MAEWDTAYINDLPDSAFAVILPGGDKDEDGKTVPRDLRKLPHHNAAGDVDMPHLRNAMSREPQADMPDAMHERAHGHLQGHMDAQSASAEAVEVEASADQVITLNVANETIQTLSASQRRLGLRIVPYNTLAEHPHYGRLMFEPGAFGKVDPKLVRLRMDHEDPPTGLGEKFTDLPDAPYIEFVVAKTERGNDQLTLAVDGISRGASVGYSEIKGRPKVRQIDGRTVTVYPPDSVVLHEVSTTWKPTFPEAGVMYVLHSEQKGTAPMGEAQEAPTNGAGIDYAKLTEAIVTASATSSRDDKLDALYSKFDEMVELQRSQFSVPQGEPRKPKLHHWVEMTLKRMAGQPLRDAELKELALDDVVTTEQPGLVPTTFTPDYDDLINATRPFLSSTRQIEAPATGSSLVLPIITTRAVAGTQAGNAEKGALTTTATKVGTGTFAYKPVFGGADISMQMILRSERSFFDLLTGDMAEAYALDSEAKAIAALIAGYTDSATVAHAPIDGGVIDPEDPQFGDAWITSIQASKRAPTHIWLSASAVGAFIDAKAPLTNAPLYAQLAGAFTAAGGPGGVLSGLTPIYVPALDDAAVDVIIGPSRGFVWAEDVARRLEADRPDVAGRDIALVGGLFPAPRFAHAFTTYTVAS